MFPLREQKSRLEAKNELLRYNLSGIAKKPNDEIENRGATYDFCQFFKME